MTEPLTDEQFEEIGHRYTEVNGEYPVGVVIVSKLMMLIMFIFASNGYGQEESKLFRILGSTVYISNAADLLSTELVLSRGGAEKNPLMGNRAIRTSAKVVMPFVFNRITAKLYQDHPKIAVAMRIAATCGYTYLATRNFQISYSMGR